MYEGLIGEFWSINIEASILTRVLLVLYNDGSDRFSRLGYKIVKIQALMISVIF